jgi:hypothetical protein
MKKSIVMATLLCFIVSCFSMSAQTQFEVDGVIIPRKIKVEDKTIELNGFGTRSKAWMGLYVQALYLTTLSQDPDFILDSETYMAIRIQITSKLVSSSKLTKSLESGFEKSCGENLKEMWPRIEQLKNMLDEPIERNDIFILAYEPIESSVIVYKNNVLKGKITGLDFKKALFGIWISNNPVDKDLKEELLGMTK